jgi:SAM-dependent methyltransferase
VDLDTAAWLASEAGRAVLAEATAYDDDAHARAAAGQAAAVDPLTAASALQRAAPDTDAALRAAALTQVRLRRRARPRLGDVVDHLLLTEDGAEQATRTAVADLRAASYAASGATHVADLGCGLGLDSLAFARAGLAVTAVERDPVVAALARANVAALALDDRVRVLDGDVTDSAVLDAALAHADAAYGDPARRDTAQRDGGRSARITEPQRWSPPWSWVQEVAARVPRTAVKVAPGVPHEMTPHGGCATWTSVDGQLVEAEIAWPALADGRARRRARVVRGTDVLMLESAVGLEHETPPPVGPVGGWVHEPDDAVIRAGLVGEVAAQLEGRLLDPHVAYVTTDLDRELGALTARYAVHHALPYDLDALRALLVADGVGTVVVKKRATSLDVDVVRRRLRLPKAAGTAVVLLARVGDDAWAYVADA